ncbi:hypothetical protein ATANTOWER_008056 [Ataeniobius toweri]|uniref:Uncharacterized protein n=1 Tax=Ataeniobius toweri TaxID=208326 RepID=A0ABU7A1U3_9TELE|nr:hypothetical protein [Ataeniobius toweri]
MKVNRDTDLIIVASVIRRCARPPPQIGTHGDLRTEIFISVCLPRQCGPNCSIRKLHLFFLSRLGCSREGSHLGAGCFFFLMPHPPCL